MRRLFLSLAPLEHVVFVEVASDDRSIRNAQPSPDDATKLRRPPTPLSYWDALEVLV